MVIKAAIFSKKGIIKNEIILRFVLLTKVTFNNKQQKNMEVWGFDFRVLFVEDEII